MLHNTSHQSSQVAGYSDRSMRHSCIEMSMDKKEAVERMNETVKISVRSLVEFILREGDIDQRRTAGADKEQMQLGARIHRKIQRQMGSELPCRSTFENGSFVRRIHTFVSKEGQMELLSGKMRLSLMRSKGFSES